MGRDNDAKHLLSLRHCIACNDLLEGRRKMISPIFTNFVPLISAYLDSGISEAWFTPVFALAFVATVPVIVKYLVR